MPAAGGALSSRPSAVRTAPVRTGALAYLLASLLALSAAPAVAASGTTGPRPAFGGLDSPIRPGSSLGGYCTFNFVFYDSVLAEDEEPVAYIGTAGHCTEVLGERVTLRGTGEIGTVVYDSDLVRSGVDFSLIRIDDRLVGRTNPQMRGFVGPTGSVTVADLTRGDVVDLYGYGLVFGRSEVTRSRQGVLVDWDEDEYVVDMPAVNGDSGSPLLQDRTGKALGVVSRYGFSAVPPSTDVGPLMPYVFRELAAAGLGDVALATVGG